MPYDKIAARMMSMDEEVWRRHANPWSGWTRVAMFPFWFLAVWARIWIGWWTLIPIALLCLWTWINPRAFAPATSDHAWMTRGVLGEQFFINRHERPVPTEHVRIAHLLTTLSLLAFVGCVFGFVYQDFWLALGGWLLCITFKLWFVDRCAWIYEDMKRSAPNACPFV